MTRAASGRRSASASSAACWFSARSPASPAAPAAPDAHASPRNHPPGVSATTDTPGPHNGSASRREESCRTRTGQHRRSAVGAALTIEARSPNRSVWGERVRSTTPAGQREHRLPRPSGRNGRCSRPSASWLVVVGRQQLAPFLAREAASAAQARRAHAVGHVPEIAVAGAREGEQLLSPLEEAGKYTRPSGSALPSARRERRSQTRTAPFAEAVTTKRSSELTSVATIPPPPELARLARGFHERVSINQVCPLAPP